LRPTPTIKIALLVALAANAASCSDPVADAKKKYDIVKKSNEKSEICDRSRTLADLYLANNMEQEYLAQKAALKEECTYTYEEAMGSK